MDVSYKPPKFDKGLKDIHDETYICPTTVLGVKP